VTGDALSTLLDRAAIEDVLVRFCRGVDRLDEDLVRSCFHDDAVDDHGMFRGPASEFAPYVVASARSMLATQHCISNVTVTFDGDVASSESYVHVVLRIRGEDGPADHTIFARYVDRFERRAGGEWLIAERVVVYDLTRIDPVGRTWSLDTSEVGR
jgi:ketosteroid isomerase-like protein